MSRKQGIHSMFTPNKVSIHTTRGVDLHMASHVSHVASFVGLGLGLVGLRLGLGLTS